MNPRPTRHPARSLLRSPVSLALWVLCWAGITSPRVHAADPVSERLSAALSFHASFDDGPDARVARGDRTLYHAASIETRNQPVAGLPATGEVTLQPAVGSPGQVLQFNKAKAPLMLFKADRNFPTPRADWSGTVSLWMSLDPAADLDPGFCDPIQLTSKKWDDAALFLEFEKRADGVPFRLGVYADTAVWNPLGRKWEEIPAPEKPLITLTKTPFSRSRWTHAAFVIEHFNTGKANGRAQLFIDGKDAGTISPRQQTFTWDPAQSVIMLGVGYVGLMDDLALFDRALTPAEISHLFTLKDGLRTLTPQP